MKALLRALAVEHRRALAKATFKLAGWTGRVRVPTRLYRFASTDPVTFERSGWDWLPNPLSSALLGWSMDLDWDHWDHWACVHDEVHCTDPCPCVECGGTACSAGVAS